MKLSVTIPTRSRISPVLLLLAAILINSVQTGNAQCAGNAIPPTVVCQPGVQLDIPPGESRTIVATDLDAGSFDDCSASNTLQFFIETGPPSATPPATTQLEFAATQAGSHPVVLWAVDEQGNAAYCTTNLEVSACQSATALACNDNIVIALGANFTATLDAFDVLEGGPYCNYDTYMVRIGQGGNFEPSITLGPADIGTQLLSVRETSTGNLCWGTLTVVPGILSEACPLLYVDLATWAIRPCFSNLYHVTYINASTFPISDTHVELTLAPGLAFESSELPETDLGNNSYRFETGNLAAGQVGRFWVRFQADCDAPVGTTYCSTAGIFPDTLCLGTQPWSGAEITVEGTCVNDSIFLKIKNIGNAAMIQALDYVVVEDVLMRSSGSFNLGAGGVMTLDPIQANGATFRLEADQEPGYPYGGQPFVAVEGCGGFTQGMVTQFPTNLSNPFTAQDCRESTASYDPNDKQARPKGVGAGRLIEKTTPLNYMIRFQNTGTDTAFRVVLVDTLSAFLDPATLRPGASSHPYSWELRSGNILRFIFDNILLPDSTVNEPASHGFVQFAIEQTADNPDGTQIDNSAAIFFDFNAPVLTNTTRHVVGSQLLLVSVDAPENGNAPLRVYPNPATDLVTFNLDQTAGKTAYRFELLDALGRPVRRLNDVNLPLALPCSGLPAGTYFFQLTETGGRGNWTGTVLVR
ncbi:MAG: T9SS type A sorting domain-containing protein [Lewinellaceae bacterium]|nr:T9SS type A sorting domain-containing protein [Lewinellaceae bacterium]